MSASRTSRVAISRLAIPLLAILCSVIGVLNWFTYDDRYIIELNPEMRDMHLWRVFSLSYWPKSWGGDGYRPITMLLFRIETLIGNGIPVVFHIANILLYGLTAYLVFRLARRMLPEWAAWVTAALFAVHPVHVEAVANVVGQSELLVAAFLLPAIALYLRDRARGNVTQRTMVQILVLYGLACCSKEHGIVLPALLAAAELTIIADARSVRERLRDPNFRLIYFMMALAGVAFVAVRAIVLSDHGIGGFQPFMPFLALHTGPVDRALTALGVVPQWIRLFFWPARLVSEYGPPEIQIAQGFALWQLPGFILLASVLALGVALRKRAPVISFGIAFICIALLPQSNFLLPAGIVLAERTLFLPSVGAMLVVGGVVVEAYKWFQARNSLTTQTIRFAAGALAVLLLAGGIHSYNRTKVWRDNETLFHTAVVDAPESYRAHYMLGAWSFEKERKRIGELEYQKAMNLFPYDPYLAFNLAEQYRRVNMCRPAIPLYRWSRELDPDFPLGRTAYANCLLELGEYDSAKAAALEVIRAGGDLKIARRMMFLADSAKAADTRSGTASGSRAVVGLAGAGRGDGVPGKQPGKAPSKVPEVTQKTARPAQKGPRA